MKPECGTLLTSLDFTIFFDILNYILISRFFLLPRLHLPPKAIAKAKEVGQAPDVFYAFQLLENTGICIIPGSGFGQKPNTYHFR